MKKLILAFFAITLISLSAQNVLAQGMKLTDPGRGMEIQAPANWGINGSKYSISLTHGTHYDAYISIKKSYYRVSTAAEAYDKRKDSLKSYLPGAQFSKEKEAVKIGSADGMSMTYKNPSNLKIIQEIFFIHKGVVYELNFKVKEENLSKVQADFATILQNIKLM